MNFAPGSRRFYPPGKHPATRQLREALAKAEEIDDGSDEIAAYIDHCRRELAKFEVGEDRAKRDYLRAAAAEGATDGCNCPRDGDMRRTGVRIERFDPCPVHAADLEGATDGD